MAYFNRGIGSLNNLGAWPSLGYGVPGSSLWFTHASPIWNVMSVPAFLLAGNLTANIDLSHGIGGTVLSPQSSLPQPTQLLPPLLASVRVAPDLSATAARAAQ